jgi:hypothetical protein
MTALLLLPTPYALVALLIVVAFAFGLLLGACAAIGILLTGVMAACEQSTREIAELREQQRTVRAEVAAAAKTSQSEHVEMVAVLTRGAEVITQKLIALQPGMN